MTVKGFWEREYHEPGCQCGYLNPVTEWAGGPYVRIVAFECPYCKKRTPVSAMGQASNFTAGDP